MNILLRKRRSARSYFIEVRHYAPGGNRTRISGVGVLRSIHYTTAASKCKTILSNTIRIIPQLNSYVNKVMIKLVIVRNSSAQS